MFRNILLLMLILTLSGCAVRYWMSGPDHVTRVDSNVFFKQYETFTIIPYSSIAPDKSGLTGREENAMMFFLANQIIERGYRYTDNMDSADFILTQRIADDYREGEQLSLLLGKAPPLTSRNTFSLLSTSWETGEATPKPMRTNYIVRSTPSLKIIAYDRASRKCIEQWAAGGVVKDVNFRAASEQLIWQFAVSLPTPWSATWKGLYGKGEAGFGFHMWSKDADNFWPDISFLEKNSPAEKAGLKPGDVVLSVDGENLKNVDYRECLRRLKGPPGRELHLLLWRWWDKIITSTVIMTSR